MQEISVNFPAVTHVTFWQEKTLTAKFFRCPLSLPPWTRLISPDKLIARYHISSEMPCARTADATEAFFARQRIEI